jgi:hypothetical protein
MRSECVLINMWKTSLFLWITGERLWISAKVGRFWSRNSPFERKTGFLRRSDDENTRLRLDLPEICLFERM